MINESLFFTSSWICWLSVGLQRVCSLVFLGQLLLHPLAHCVKEGTVVSTVSWSPNVLLSWSSVCPASLRHKGLSISCLGSCIILGNGLEVFQCIFLSLLEWIPEPDFVVECLLCCRLVRSRFRCFFSHHLVDYCYVREVPVQSHAIQAD